MANFSIEQFKSEVFNGGLARPNRFEVHLPTDIPGSSQLAVLSSLFCEVGSLPPLGIEMRRMRIQGPAYQRGTNVDYGGVISLTFIVDRLMMVRRYFEIWSTLVINPATFSVGFHSDYAKTITLHQLDEAENINYSISLIDAFPTAISQMDLNQSSNDIAHRLTVSFAYRYWESEDIKNDSAFTAEVSGPAAAFKSREPALQKPSIQPPIGATTPKTNPPQQTSGNNLGGAATGREAGSRRRGTLGGAPRLGQ